MDILTFIVQISAAVAWPLVAIVALFIFRKPITGLFGFLQKLKYKDLELEFGKRLEELQEEAPPEQAPIDPIILNKNLQLAQASPRAAILESWLSVETAAIKALQAHDIALPRRSPMEVQRALTKAQLLDAAHADTFSQLRHVRNEAVHIPEAAITPSMAIQYMNVANSITSFFEKGGEDRS